MKLAQALPWYGPNRSRVSFDRRSRPVTLSVMSLVLVGYRGCGKTTVGEILARRAKLQLCDTDNLIVAASHLTIGELFARHGEAHFRDLEAIALGQALSVPNSIISTGGGIVVREQNRDALRNAGRQVIYLYASPETLHDRITADEKSPINRPRLTSLGGGLDEVRHLLEVRDPLYREVANLVIDVTLLTPDEIAYAILRGCEEDGHNG